MRTITLTRTENAKTTYAMKARKAGKVARLYLFKMPAFKTKGREASILRWAYRSTMAALATA